MARIVISPVSDLAGCFGLTPYPADGVLFDKLLAADDDTAYLAGAGGGGAWRGEFGVDFPDGLDGQKIIGLTATVRAKAMTGTAKIMVMLIKVPLGGGEPYAIADVGAVYETHSRAFVVSMDGDYFTPDSDFILAVWPYVGDPGNAVRLTFVQVELITPNPRNGTRINFTPFLPAGRG